jgi:hypothetical protein
VVIAEVELRQIAVQVLLAAMLINAAHATEAALIGVQAAFVVDVVHHDLADRDFVRGGIWNERTLPPRSTSVTIARLFDGPPLPDLMNFAPEVRAVRIFADSTPLKYVSSA